MRVRQVASLIFLVLAFGVGYWFQREGLVDLDPRDLRAEIESLGWWAPVVFMAAAASRPFLLLPSFVVMSVGGMLFGWLGGVVFSTLGFSFGAIVVFLLARGMGREAIQKRVAAGRLAAVDAFLSDRGAPWLGFYTALPVTFLTPAFAASGLSGMPLGGFSLWVTLGLVPRTALYSFFGNSLTKGSSQIVVASVVLGTACLIGIVVARRMLKGRREQRPADRDSRSEKA